MIVLHDDNGKLKLIKEPKLKEIQEYLDYCQQEVINANTRLAEYRKDKDIQELENENKYLKSHSLFLMSDLELKKGKDFRAEHYKSCKNGGTYWYKLTGTGIGTAISIKCDTCGAEENITDTTNW